MDQKERSAQLTEYLREVRAFVAKCESLTHTWLFAASALWAMENRTYLKITISFLAAGIGAAVERHQSGVANRSA
ncbi:hypothetical protein [Candidatus Nitrospira bockiana]